MKFRTTALALLALSSTSLAACSSAQECAIPRPAPSAPCRALLPSSDDDLDGNAWAEAVASHGTLDYVGGHEYGTVIVASSGQVLGYALAEDSTVYPTAECALSNGPGYAS